MRVKTTMLFFFHLIDNPYIFKHKISITLLLFLICLWMELNQSNCKITKNAVIISTLREYSLLRQVAIMLSPNSMQSTAKEKIRIQSGKS